ncbi:uncharacterized protein LOC124445254 [Xenia sp. Carnegie-2017]|uniref:uncharacterized protein LOC124445254 n=1 Tax=Xenia sp. Carnegie-2017 TaxID=2897299 RepID=UPI001F03676A|nr:uncharacterized protein LOC124445254 [Xenia sp. Carnegie-2017]
MSMSEQLSSTPVLEENVQLGPGSCNSGPGLAGIARGTTFGSSRRRRRGGGHRSEGRDRGSRRGLCTRRHPRPFSVGVLTVGNAFARELAVESLLRREGLLVESGPAVHVLVGVDRLPEQEERRAAKFKSVKNFFHFNEADKAVITLYVEEFPFPNITCYKDSKVIIFCIGKKMKDTPNFNSLACEQDQYGLNGVPQLIIESISFVGDDGKYTCVATTNNPPGKDVVSFYVNVGVPPSISRGNSKYFTARNNTEGEIKCMIRWSNPRPNITWYQQIVINSSEPVSNNWTLSLYKSSFKKGKNKGQYESILKIPWSEDEASMWFRCVAQNIHGNDSRMFMFIRYGDNFDLFKVFPSGEVILNENEDFMAICRVDGVLMFCMPLISINDLRRP